MFITIPYASKCMGGLQGSRHPCDNGLIRPMHRGDGQV